MEKSVIVFENAAFELCTALAQHGQMIYLRHHRHLTDIARKGGPSVRVYDFEEINWTARLNGAAAD